MKDDIFDRCMLLRIPERDVLDNILNHDGSYFIFRRAELPEGYCIGAVYRDETTRDFVFQIHHPSFQPIGINEKIPYLETTLLQPKIYRACPEVGSSDLLYHHLMFCHECRGVVVVIDASGIERVITDQCSFCKKRTTFEKVQLSKK